MKLVLVESAEFRENASIRRLKFDDFILFLAYTDTNCEER